MVARPQTAHLTSITLAALLLAACESGPLLQEDLSFDPLRGEWSACLNDGGADHSTYLLFFPDASFRLTTRTYATSDGTCAGAETGVSHAPLSYRLLDPVPTRIGPDGREVVATQMDIEGTFERVYTIVYVDGQVTPAVLYFGDLALDPLENGTAPERRPDVLSTSTALVGQ